MLDYLQVHLETGVSSSTSKVYVVSITVEHVPAWGQQSFVSHFMCGGHRLRHFQSNHILVWALSLVLEVCSLIFSS